MTERGQEVHQSFHRENSGSVLQLERHVRLLDAEELASLRLREMARLMMR